MKRLTSPQTMERSGASQLKLQIQSICAKLASLGEESMFVSVNIRENLTNYAGSSLGKAYVMKKGEILQQFYEFCKSAYSSEVCAIRFNDEKESRPVQPQPISGTYAPNRPSNPGQFNANRRPSPYKPGMPRMNTNQTTPPKNINMRGAAPQYPGRFPSPNYQSREPTSPYQNRDQFGRPQNNNSFERPKPSSNNTEGEAPVGTKSIVYIGFDEDKQKGQQANSNINRSPSNRGRGTFPGRGMMGSPSFRPRNPQIQLRPNMMGRNMPMNGNRPPGSLAAARAQERERALSAAMKAKKPIRDDDCIIIDGDDDVPQATKTNPPKPPSNPGNKAPNNPPSNQPIQIEMGQLPQYQNIHQKQFHNNQQNGQKNPVPSPNRGQMQQGHGQMQQGQGQGQPLQSTQAILQSQMNRGQPSQYRPNQQSNQSPQLQHNQLTQSNQSSQFPFNQLTQANQLAGAQLQHNQLTQSGQSAQLQHNQLTANNQSQGSLSLPVKVSSTQPPQLQQGFNPSVQKGQVGQFGQFNQPQQNPANTTSQDQVSNFQTKPSVQNPWGMNNPPIFPLGRLPIKIESIESTGFKVESTESLMMGQVSGAVPADHNPKSQIMKAESSQQIKVENTETSEIFPMNVQPLHTPPDTPQVVIENVEGNPISDREVMAQLERTDVPDTTYKSEPETTEVSPKSGKFKCKVCSKSYPTAAILKTHMSVHYGLRPYKCTACGKQFSSLSYLKSHKKIHSGDKPHKCSVCDAQFSLLQAYKVHMKTHSVEDKQKGDKPFHCEICGKQFTWISNLKAHRKSHSSNDKMHKCSTCGKELSTLGSLNNHIRTHTGEKPFKCETCGKRFIQAVQLKSHSRVHGKNKPYTCNICDQKFSHMAKMKVHLKKHQNE